MTLDPETAEKIGKMSGQLEILIPKVDATCDLMTKILQDGCPRGKSNTHRITAALSLALAAWVTMTGWLIANMIEDSKEFDRTVKEVVERDR